MPTASQFRDRIQAAVVAAVGRPLTWAIVIGLAAAWPIAWALLTPLPPRLPVLGTVPPFELTAQDGGRFGSKDLAGRVWLASFMSTRESAGLATSRQMARIQARTRNLEPVFHLVSISVDPGFDDPGRLAAYARAHRASPRMWTFLTGAVGPIRDAISQGTHLVLVDGESRIRGYYDVQDAGSVDGVVRDAALLVNRR
jgi:protein SCO1/2